MPEPTKSTQEAVRTTGSNPGSATGSSTGGSVAGGAAGASMSPGMTGATAGYSAGQPSGGQPPGSVQTASGAGGARQAREHSSSGPGGYGRGGTSPMTGSAMGHGADEAYRRASHGLNEAWEQAMDYGRENPGKSVMIAFGVGVGVGLLMANGFATRSRTRRLVPPVMNAISEIASEFFR